MLQCEAVDIFMFLQINKSYIYMQNYRMNIMLHVSQMYVCMMPPASMQTSNFP